MVRNVLSGTNLSNFYAHKNKHFFVETFPFKKIVSNETCDVHRTSNRVLKASQAASQRGGASLRHSSGGPPHLAAGIAILGVAG